MNLWNYSGSSGWRITVWSDSGPAVRHHFTMNPKPEDAKRPTRITDQPKTHTKPTDEPAKIEPGRKRAEYTCVPVLRVSRYGMNY